MKKSLLSITAIATVASIAFTSCKKSDDNSAPSYSVPATYNFSNVNYNDQKMLLAMVAQIEAEMKKGTTSGVVVDAQKIKEMFANTGNHFVDSAYQLNASGLQIKSKCQTAAQTDIQNYMDSLGVASQSTVAGSNGVAGVVVGSDPSKKYLLNANGFNYAQLFTKSVMGGMIAYQIVTTVSDASQSLDNNTAVAGQGTAMEHAWDQAFGYWNVPVDFPATKTGLKYWASYSNQIDSGIHCNAALMTAFLTGRAAISNKDMNTKQAQANAIIALFEKMTAAAAIHELHEAKQILSDNGKRNTNLSECMGFILSMRYNPKRVIITDAQINQILALFGDNLYNMPVANIDTIINTISSIYGFDAVKDII